MSRKSTSWLIIASSLVAIAIAMFAVVMTICGWDFTKLSTNVYETNTYEIHETFSDISVETKTANIIVAVTDDTVCKIECHEDIKMKHSVEVKNDTLTIKVNDERSWQDHMGVDFQSPQIKIYLPEAEYNSLFIKASTSDVTITNMLCKEKLQVEVSTGDVDIVRSDAKEISLQTSTGDVEAKLLSDKIFDVKTGTGEVDVPKTTSGGKCKVVTGTGDITINIE